MKIFIKLGVFALMLIASVFCNYYYIMYFGPSRIAVREQFADIKNVLIPGAGRGYIEGLPNPTLKGRVDTAASIWHAYKYSKLIISGYEYVNHFDETAEILAALKDQGVPESACLLDSKSADTFETLQFYKDNFGNEPVIIITQQEHLERALWLADKFGLEAWGYPVDELSVSRYNKFFLRELGARVKARIEVFIYL